ncbi:hypothetical protein RCL1_001911 [Eukaryota sp. TZLM3-RCL]
MLEEETSKKILAAFQAKDRAIADLKTSLTVSRNKCDELTSRLSSSTHHYETTIKDLEQRLSLLSPTYPPPPSSTPPPNHTSSSTQTTLSSSDVDSLFQSSSSKSEEINDLQIKLNKANSLVSDLRSSKKDLLLALAEKERELEHSISRIEKLTHLDKENSAQISKQTNQIQKQSSIINDLRTRVDSLASRYSSPSQSILQETPSTATLSQLKEACTAISMLRTECCKWRERVAQLEVVIESNGLEIVELQQSNHLFKAKLECCEAENVVLNDQIKKFEAEIEQFNKEIKEKEVRKKEVGTLTLTPSSLVTPHRASISTMDQNEELNSIIAERNTLSRQVALLRSNNEQLIKERDQAINQAQKSSEECDILIDQLEAIKLEPTPTLNQLTSVDRGVQSNLIVHSFAKSCQTDDSPFVLPIFPLSQPLSPDPMSILAVLPLISTWFSSLNLTNAVNFCEVVAEVVEKAHNSEENYLQMIEKFQSNSVALILTSRAQLALFKSQRVTPPKASGIIASQKSLIKDLRERISFFENSIKKFGGNKALIGINSAFLANVSISKLLNSANMGQRVALLNKRIEFLTRKNDLMRAKVCQYQKLVSKIQNNQNVEKVKNGLVVSYHDSKRVLNLELKEARNKIQIFEENFEHLKEKFKTAQNDLKRKETIISNIKIELETVKTEEESWTVKFDEITSRCRQLQQENSRLSNRLDNFKNQSKSGPNTAQLKSKIAELSEQLDKKSTEVNTLQSRIKYLTESIKNQKDIINQLSRDLHTLQSLEAQQSTVEEKVQSKRSEEVKPPIISKLAETVFNYISKLINSSKPRFEPRLSLRELPLDVLSTFSTSDLKSILNTSPFDQILSDAGQAMNRIIEGHNLEENLIEFELLLSLLSDAARMCTEDY